MLFRVINIDTGEARNVTERYARSFERTRNREMLLGKTQTHLVVERASDGSRTMVPISEFSANRDQYHHLFEELAEEGVA